MRYRGVELDVTGEILPGWNLIGVYAYIDSEITKGVNAGNRLRNVPEHGGSLWTTYTLQRTQLRGLKFGAGIVARSQREGSDANDFQLPGYAMFNTLLAYETEIARTKVTTQLNIDNLLDKVHFETGRPDRSFWGAPRTFLGSVRVQF